MSDLYDDSWKQFPCMICWTGAIQTGYCQRRINGKLTLVHRYEWENHFGKVPIGKFVLHKCDNRSCYQIKHLFLGTQTDNMRDMLAKGRGNYHTTISDDDVRGICNRYFTGLETRKQIAISLGIHEVTVGKIVNGKRRKDVTGIT